MGKCQICGEIKPIGTTSYGIVCISCLRKGNIMPISKSAYLTAENTMSAMPTAEQIQQLLAQNQALQTRLSQLETQEQQRTASIKISPRSGNLTLTWFKHGGQQGGRGSWMIPSKERDGRSYIRCAGVPATLRLNGSQVEIIAVLPVDANEARTFTNEFTNKQEVIVKRVQRDGGQSIPQATIPVAPIPVASIPATPIAPSVPVDTILDEARKLMPTGLFKTEAEAVEAVKRKYGIK